MLEISCCLFWSIKISAYRIRFFIIGPMIMAMIIFMRSAGINGITQIPRAALKVESATMQNHTVPKR